jgi:tetratricopeptide (TPR) repeat protein
MPNFDVFLSHNSKDKPAVEQIARALRDKHELKCWLDKWNLVPGETWEESIEDALDDCQTYAVFLGPSGIGPWENEEFRSALDIRVRDKKRRVIPVLLPNAPDNRELKLPRFLQRLTWVDFRSGLDDEGALYRLVCGIQGIAPGDISKNDRKLPTEGELPPPGTLPPGSRMYFGHNPNFTGRVADLCALAKALVYEPQPGALTVTQTLAGMGGIGKTQLAVEFCYRYGRFFNGVHWMDARQTLDAEIAACGAKMNLPDWPQTTPEQLRLTLNAWQAEPKRLLVLDNLEEPEVLRAWKPEFEGMSVLVTSRNQTWDTDLASMHTINILAPAEGMALLRKLAPRLEKLPDEEIDLVARKLGYLPLALDLAGRYLRDHPLTPQGYLEKLRETALKHKSLKETKTGSPTRHDTDVETTFLVSWEQLLDNEIDELAKHFFIAAGYLAPNIPIPHDVFSYLAIPKDEWDEWLESDDEKLDMSKYSDDVDDALLRLQALGLLTETLALHPLLAEFARAQATDNAILTALADKMAVLSNQANNTGIPADFAPLRSHLEAIAPTAEHAAPNVTGTLWSILGFYLFVIAEYSAAENAHTQALAIYEKHLGDDHSLIAIACNNLAAVRQAMGDLPGAKTHLERALAIFEKYLGAEHPSVATLVNNLGMVQKGMGDLSGAKTHLERALGIWEKQFGAEHPQVAIGVNNLGSLLQDMGDLPGAKAMYERALGIWEKQFGLEHPQVAIGVNNLGSLLQAMGDLPGAKAYLERGLAIREKQLGKEHPDVAQSVNNLGMVLKDMGDLPGAKAMFEHALMIWEKQFGAEHPQIAISVNNLGLVMQAMSDLPGAKACFERSLAIDEKTYDKEHPGIAVDLHNLAILLAGMGDLPQALDLEQRALAMFQKFLPPEHPNIDTARRELAEIERRMKDSEQADE